jgi:hypothetical protein
MRHEHAITYQDQLTIADLEYLVRKANRLGRFGKELVRISSEKDVEGTHVYFDVEGTLNGSQRDQ